MANRTKGITIEQLYKECAKQIKAGNKDRHVMLSNDDEGNGYHELFFGFMPTKECVSDDYLLPYGVTMQEAEKEYIVLG